MPDLTQQQLNPVVEKPIQKIEPAPIASSPAEQHSQSIELLSLEEQLAQLEQPIQPVYSPPK